MGIRVPDSITVDGQPLVLNGMGLREATMFNVVPSDAG
ncbi:MAG: chalcone isomerase family protein [Myxococcota bacterium]